MNGPTAVDADLATSVCKNYEADQTDNFLSEHQCETVDIWTFVLLEQVAAFFVQKYSYDSDNNIKLLVHVWWRK
jgi:hypothetical protein